MKTSPRPSLHSGLLVSYVRMAKTLLSFDLLVVDYKTTAITLAVDYSKYSSIILFYMLSMRILAKNTVCYLLMCWLGTAAMILAAVVYSLISYYSNNHENS
jgi:hypothetical protein